MYGFFWLCVFKAFPPTLSQTVQSHIQKTLSVCMSVCMYMCLAVSEIIGSQGLAVFPPGSLQMTGVSRLNECGVWAVMGKMMWELLVCVCVLVTQAIIPSGSTGRQGSRGLGQDRTRPDTRSPHCKHRTTTDTKGRKGQSYSSIYHHQNTGS